nr:uncharacterized protein LOC111425212 [Onthophagus taurus]
MNTEALKTLFSSFDARQLINEPTRITRTSSKLIDLLFAFCTVDVRHSGVIASQISDHDIIFCVLSLAESFSTGSCRVRRSLDTIDVAGFREFLKQISFNHIFFIEDINEKLPFLNNGILSAFEVFSPVVCRPKSSRIRPPWLTDNLKFMISLRDKAKANFKKNPSSARWDYYKSLRNLTAFTVKAEKRAYFRHIGNMRDRRQLWFKLGSLSLKKKSVSGIPDALKNVNELNDYFLKSISDILDSMPLDQSVLDFYTSLPNNGGVFEFSTVCPTLVEKLVYDLRSCSEGSDGISADMIKLACPVILPYFTHILNVCIAEGRFPDIWKHALIKPIPKNQNPTSFSHLRPISLLPAFSDSGEDTKTATCGISS